MRSMAMMAALSFVGVACGVQADQRPEVAPQVEGGDLEPASVERTENGEAVGEAEEDLGLLKTIHCTPNEEGAPCARKCEAAGIWCPSAYGHPYKRDAGDGDLDECREAVGARSCWYHYESNGDRCWTRTFLGKRLDPLCIYKRENP